MSFSVDYSYRTEHLLKEENQIKTNTCTFVLSVEKLRLPVLRFVALFHLQETLALPCPALLPTAPGQFLVIFLRLMLTLHVAR